MGLGGGIIFIFYPTPAVGGFVFYTHPCLPAKACAIGTCALGALAKAGTCRITEDRFVEGLMEI